MKLRNKTIFICCLVVFLQSCDRYSTIDMESSLMEIQSQLTYMSNHNKRLSELNSTIPDVVDDALKQASEQVSDQERKYNITVNAMPAAEFFANISEQTNQNIILDEAIVDNISLSLRNVTLNDITDAISEIYGYNFVKRPNALLVKPSKIETRMFSLEGLSLKRSGSSRLNVDSSSSQGGSNSSS